MVSLISTLGQSINPLNKIIGASVATIDRTNVSRPTHPHFSAIGDRRLPEISIERNIRAAAPVNA